MYYKNTILVLYVSKKVHFFTPFCELSSKILFTIGIPATSQGSFFHPASIEHALSQK